MDFLNAVEKIKSKIVLDPGVFDVSPSNRFGDYVISIGCITDKDRERIDKIIPDPFEGYHIHLYGPIWGIGGLKPENKKKFEELIKIREYVTSGTEQNRQLHQFKTMIIEEDKVIWSSMTDIQRKKWLKEYIIKRRAIDSHFGNCADKFL